MALTLVLFCFAGCGEETISDETDTQNADTQQDQNDPTLTPTGDNVKVGMEIKDPAALLALLGAEGTEDLDIKNISFDMTASEQGAFALALGAKLFGEDHKATLYLSESIALSTTLLDKAYGVSDIEKFAANIAVMLETVMPEDAAPFDPDTVVNFAAKYYAMLITELRTNGGLTVSDKDGVTTMSGTLTTDAASVIVVNILEELCKDDDFFTIFDIDKEDFLKDKPAKAELLKTMKEQLAQTGIALEIKTLKIDAQMIPVAMDIKLSITSTDTLSLSYDLDALTFALDYKDANNNYIKASINEKGADVDISFASADDDNESATKLTLTVKENNIKLTMLDTSESNYVSPGYSSSYKYSTDILFEMTDSALTLITKETSTENGNDDLQSWNGSSEDITEIKATFSKAGGELTYKNDYKQTNSRYPEYNSTSSEEYKAKLTIAENQITLDITAEGQTISLSIKQTDNNILGEISQNGQQLAALLIDKKVEGSKTTYTFVSLVYAGTTTDLSKAGISFYVDTNATMEALTSFTAVDNFTPDQFAEIADNFTQKNAALIEKLADLFGEMGAVDEMPNYSENVEFID